MIEEVGLEVTGNVTVFGEFLLPRGTYPGAIESYVIRPDGREQRVPASALICVDRRVLEGLGAEIVPNRETVDFAVLSYIESGDIRIAR
jgi:hypothetical protein